MNEYMHERVADRGETSCHSHSLGGRSWREQDAEIIDFNFLIF